MFTLQLRQRRLSGAVGQDGELYFRACDLSKLLRYKRKYTLSCHKDSRPLAAIVSERCHVIFPLRVLSEKYHPYTAALIHGRSRQLRKRLSPSNDLDLFCTLMTRVRVTLTGDDRPLLTVSENGLYFRFWLEGFILQQMRKQNSFSRISSTLPASPALFREPEPIPMVPSSSHLPQLLSKPPILDPRNPSLGQSHAPVSSHLVQCPPQSPTSTVPARNASLPSIIRCGSDTYSILIEKEPPKMTIIFSNMCAHLLKVLKQRESSDHLVNVLNQRVS